MELARNEADELLDAEKIDVEAEINDLYPDEGQPSTPVEEPVEEAAPEPEEAEEKPDNPVLPPGFTPDGTEPEPTDEAEEDPENIEMSEIDAAIEAETNENKKINMARMRTKLQAQEARLAELEKAQTEGTEQVPEDVQKQLDEAYDKIAKLDLSQDPRFQAKYDQRIRETIKGITRLVVDNFESEEEAAQVVTSLANMDPISRQKFMIDNDVPEYYRNEVALRFREADSIFQERQSALENFQESRKALEVESTVDNQQQLSQVREAIFKDTVSKLQSAEPLLSHQPGKKEYNNFVDERLKLSREIVESNDPKVQTEFLVKGALTDTYKAMFELTQRELVEAKKELERYKGGKPDFNGGGSSPAGATGKNLPDSNDALADFIINS
jgi:hypothetical protein